MTWFGTWQGSYGGSYWGGLSAPPEPVPRSRGDDGGARRRFWRDLEPHIETIEAVAASARKRPVTAARIEAAQTALEALTEAHAPPIAVAGIEHAIDALQAATAGRMAFAKALERHVAMIRAEHKRRKRNEEAAFVLLLAS